MLAGWRGNALTQRTSRSGVRIKNGTLLAFGAAIFAGVVTLVSMGFFQQRSPGQAPAALQLALIVAGVTFIVVLVMVALLLLAVDPAQVKKQIDRPVLLPDESADGAGRRR